MIEVAAADVLAEALNQEAIAAGLPHRCTVGLARFHFSGGTSSNPVHSLELAHSDEARIRAHWSGYVTPTARDLGPLPPDATDATRGGHLGQGLGRGVKP